MVHNHTVIDRPWLLLKIAADKSRVRDGHLWACMIESIFPMLYNQGALRSLAVCVGLGHEVL